MSADHNDVQKFLRKPIFTVPATVFNDPVTVRNYKALNVVTLFVIRSELEKRGVSREKQRIAQYLTNGAFLAFIYLPAEGSGKVSKEGSVKVSKKIVEIIAKQVVVNETYHYVVNTFELDYPEFIKKRSYLHKIARVVCTFVVKRGMYTVLNSLISQFKDRNK